MASLEELAQEAEDSGEFERALKLWRQLASVTSDPIILCRLGSVASQLKKWQEAEEAFNRAIKLDHSLSLAMECLADLFRSRDDADHAVNLAVAREWLLRAVKIDKTARALTVLGATCAAMGDRDAALDALSEAIQVNDSYEEAYFNLALLEKEANPQRAVTMLEKAVELDTNYLEAHQQLGILCQKQRKLLEAEYHFRRCVEIDPADYWALLYLANNLAVQGHSGTAEERFRAAIDLRPDDPTAYEFFADWLDENSRSEEATSVRERLRDLR